MRIFPVITMQLNDIACCCMLCMIEGSLSTVVCMGLRVEDLFSVLARCNGMATVSKTYTPIHMILVY